MKHAFTYKLLLLILGIGLLFCLEQFSGEKESVFSTQEEWMEEEVDDLETEEGEAETAREVVPPNPEFDGNIRVLIKNTEYQDIYHERLDIVDADGQEWVIERVGQAWHVNGEALDPESVPVRLDEVSEGCYYVKSLQRSIGSPAYKGALEIYPTKEGVVLINELPLETYLAYVVPSEMPASYEMEALKAQAVCARTYAYNHTKEYAYPGYAAHVDDSVRYQVYYNLNAAERSNEAVAETRGRILTYNGEAIEAYYFSTSAGHTSNAEIWQNGDVENTPYLVGKTTGPSGEGMDLTGEEEFATFIRQTESDSFDRESGWFRWSVEVDVELLSQHVNEALAGRYEASPELILTRKRGQYVSMPVEDIGDIERIQVLERGVGGVLQKIEIMGSKKTIQVSTEYEIRALLHANGEEIIRGDGSRVSGGTLLPSGYFMITPKLNGKKVTGFLFEGGGFGHGVGMSQNGANQMAKEGYSWEEILKFFYTEVELSELEEGKVL